MALSSRMTAYIAPDGYVYDYAEPRIATIIEPDGTRAEREEHIYAKYLYLSNRDDINNYKVVKDPKVKE